MLEEYPGSWDALITLFFKIEELQVDSLPHTPKIASPDPIGHFWAILDYLGSHRRNHQVKIIAGRTKLVLYNQIRGLKCYELRPNKWQFIWFYLFQDSIGHFGLSRHCGVAGGE